MGVSLADRPAGQYRRFGVRLKASRIRRGKTVAQVATGSDVTVETLRRWESGQLTRAPREAQLFRVAKALDVDAFWLLEGIPLASINENPE